MLLDVEESCIVRWVRKVLKGDSDVSVSPKSRFGCLDVGTNFIGEGEGRTSRLLRSKS